MYLEKLMDIMSPIEDILLERADAIRETSSKGFRVSSCYIYSLWRLL